MKNKKDSPLRVICGFPGVGKEHMSQQYPGEVSNLEMTAYAWLTPTIRNPKFPQNYIDAIKQCSGLVLVSSHKDVRECLSRNRIQFSVCYPRVNCKHSYLERYRERGHPEAFIRLMDIMWADWHHQLSEDNRSAQRIVLAPHEYISDVVAIT